MTKVLVVIVTYNAHRWIRQCLDSVDRQRYDVFVIDNASTDDTVQILAEYPDCLTHPSATNLGFGQANNIGLRYAVDKGYDYVLLLNQDAWLLPDTIEQLVALQQQNPAYWILSPMQMNTERGGLERQFESYLPKDYSRTPVLAVSFVNAALWLIPVACVKQVGGFDPLFPHYGEDNDYLQRVRYWGGRVGICTGVAAYHEREVSSQDSSKRLYRTTLGYLNLLKDINHPLCVTILTVWGYCLRKVLKYIFTGQFRMAGISFSALHHCHRQLASVKHHRLLSKQQGAFLIES